jgi:hypothetical protein
VAEKGPFLPFALPEFISYPVFAPYALIACCLALLKSGRIRGMDAPIMTNVFSMTTQFMKGTVLTGDKFVRTREENGALVEGNLQE